MQIPSHPRIAGDVKAPDERSVNGIGLLNLIRQRGPVSRADLAKLSRLSKPTVSTQVESLMRQNLVFEHGPGSSGARGGKKPTLLRFNADCGRLVAVEIDPEHINAAITDMEGRILNRGQVATRVELGADRVLGRVENMVQKLLQGLPARVGEQRLISVAASGRVDVGRGVVLEAGNLFNWRDVPVRERLQKSCGLPVLVDNNVNLAALGEMHHGAARGERDFVLCRADMGIGAAVVIRGELYHGRRWAAGEIAHMLLDLGRTSEDWSARGYLESVVGADCIAARARLASPDLRAVAQFLGSAPRAGRPARAIRDSVVLHLGIALANLTCVYDPALLVLEGEILKPIFDDLCRIMEQAIPWPTKVCLSEISEEAVLLGAIVAARSHAYEKIASAIAEQEPPLRPVVSTVVTD